MTTIEKPAGLDDAMDGIGLAAGAANIIMQLSWPGVGYGVYESRVESGRLFDHPYKRSRTTLSYLAVAAKGTDDEKRLFRNGVNKAHAQVRSTGASPVEYNAFDPELQLWVAACIYRGFEDVHRALYGPIPAHAIDYFYQRGATFGTTLQVKPDMWPADRELFEEYWNDSLAKVRIDDVIREHLLSIARMEFLPKPVSLVAGPINMFFTAGSCRNGSATRCCCRGHPATNADSTASCAQSARSTSNFRLRSAKRRTDYSWPTCGGGSRPDARWCSGVRWRSESLLKFAPAWAGAGENRQKPSVPM